MIMMPAFFLLCLCELCITVMTVRCCIVQRLFFAGQRQHWDALAEDLGNFPILTHDVFKELSHDVVAAINGRIRLMLLVFGYPVAREATDFMSIYDLSGSGIIIIIIIIIIGDGLQKTFEVANEVEWYVMLLLTIAKFHRAFVLILRIWISDHLRRMPNTLRLVLLQKICT